MEIFLEYLNYGAIGVALALAILSYRLLSKEQEKEQVREPMLKSIRNYFFMSIFLSLFFGIAEITVLLISPADKIVKSDVERKVNDLYSRLLSDKNDESLDAKMKTIEYYLNKGIHPEFDSDCQELEKTVSKLKAEINSNKKGNYLETVMRLRKLVDNDPLNFINIEHEMDQKDDHYSLLYKILSYHSLVEESAKNSKDQILEAWKIYKKMHAFVNSKNPANYIVNSDIDVLLASAY